MADVERQRRREGPYEIENIAHAGFPTIIVLDRGGCSDGASQWQFSHSGNRNLVDVCSQGHINQMQGVREDMT